MNGNAKHVRRPILSNPNVTFSAKNPISDDGNVLCEVPNLLTKEEADKLVHSLDNGLFGKEWSPEGYDRRHKVQRYYPPSNETSLDSDVSTEATFGWIFDRLVSSCNTSSSSLLKHRPYEIVVIEHTPSSCRSIVNVYEQFHRCPCEHKYQNDTQQTMYTKCTCYTAQLTLISNAIQHMEKPLHRNLECWDIANPPEVHATTVTMEENGGVIKMGEFLWEWRGRISDVQETTADNVSTDGSNTPTEVSDASNTTDLCNEMKILDVVTGEKKTIGWTRKKKLKSLDRRCIIVTFRGIRPPSQLPAEPLPDASTLLKQHQLLNLPLSQLLTIVVTTSPIRSNPSTEMMEQTFDSFQFAGDEFAFECPKVIVCDGCRVFDEEDSNNGDSGKRRSVDSSDSDYIPPKITKKYANCKQKLRNGIATVDQSKNYGEFKKALQKICEEANNTSAKTEKSPFANTQVVELEDRHGYGFALRHALYHNVHTPYVCVIQHDRNFVRLTPVKEAVTAMISDPMQRIKYVGINMRSNLMSYDIFAGQFQSYSTMLQ